MSDTKTNDTQPTGPLFAPGVDDDDANDRLAPLGLARAMPCATRRVSVRNMTFQMPPPCDAGTDYYVCYSTLVMMLLVVVARRVAV